LPQTTRYTITDANKVIDIDGLPEVPIASLRLTDVIGSGKVGLILHGTPARWNCIIYK